MAEGLQVRMDRRFIQEGASLSQGRRAPDVSNGRRVVVIATGLDRGNETSIWWAVLGLNQLPLPCEGSALSLS